MFVYTLKLKTNLDTERKLAQRFRMAEDIYKTTLREILKRQRKQNKDPRQKQLKNLNKLFHELTDEKESSKKTKVKFPVEKATLLKEVTEQRKKLYLELDKDYGLEGKYTFSKFANDYRNNRNYHPYIPSDCAVKLGVRAWESYAKVKFNKGSNRVDLHRPLSSFEGSKDVAVTVRNGLLKFGTKHAKLEVPIIYKNDNYEQEALRNTLKFNRVIRRFENGKYQYYVQMILDGTPPQKKKKSSLNGNVGLHLGLTKLATSSHYEVDIHELAPGIDKKQEEIAKLQQELDNKRRINNPQNYNDNGTIKKGPKKWFNSKRYLKQKAKLNNLMRKQAEQRKLAHKTLANKIVDQGDNFIIHQPKIADLAKRSEKDELTQKGTNKSKTRFGKVIANKAPYLLIEQIKYKAAYQGKNVVLFNNKDIPTLKAFNHTTNTIDETELELLSNNKSQTKTIDNKLVQSDLYAAYLLEHSDEKGSNINVELATKNFNTFIRNQDEFLRQLNQ